MSSPLILQTTKQSRLVVRWCYQTTKQGRWVARWCYQTTKNIVLLFNLCEILRAPSYDWNHSGTLYNSFNTWQKDLFLLLLKKSKFIKLHKHYVQCVQCRNTWIWIDIFCISCCFHPLDITGSNVRPWKVI